MSAVLILSLATAFGNYHLYKYLLPYSSTPAGTCGYCGERTALGPHGWAAFCFSHTPHFLILQWLLIMVEAVLSCITVVAFWYMIRLFSQRGGRPASLVIIALGVICVVAFLGYVHGRVGLMTKFFASMLLSLYFLSAIYVEGMESFILIFMLAFIGALMMVLLIHLISLFLTGYMEVA